MLRAGHDARRSFPPRLRTIAESGPGDGHGQHVHVFSQWTCSTVETMDVPTLSSHGFCHV